MIEFTDGIASYTMEYEGKYGNKGVMPSETLFTHRIGVHTANTSYEKNKDVSLGGELPITTVYGLKIPVVTLDGYFPYRYPDDFWNEFMPTLDPFRIKNSVKNIFLVASILTVVSNSEQSFAELPVGSMWYVKSYEWKRNVQHKDRGAFTLILWRWYR